MKIDTRKNSGQAMMEMALSMIVFVLLIGAASSYYKVMRTAVIRQEVARNLIFAKINNAGSLTSIPSSSTGGRLDLKNGFSVDGGGDLITSQEACFALIPGDEARIEVPVIYDSENGATRTKNVEITTYAVIHRKPGGSCVN